jgi:hypothetical protein
VTDGVSADAPMTTGDARVDVALTRLQDLDGLDLPAQLEVFTDVQAELAVILDSAEDAGSQSAPEIDDGTLRSPAS